MPPALSLSITPRLFQKRMLDWFDQHGRKHLPWQQNKTPYRVWISEIMLQQTQVNTVIPYFERFMQRYPNLMSLAQAQLDDVLHLWAGLGYYSRARNLHRAAKMLVENFNGELPDNVADLQSLPGIGESTAGAIISIAFNQAAAILDGNVKRVLARFHAISEPINEKTVENKLWVLAKKYTPHQRTADYTQAMMDLGATLCTRSKPQCQHCPLRKRCAAYAQNLVEQLPQKKAARTLPTRTAMFFIFKKGKRVLLCKRPSTGIWGGLWSLPELSGQPEKKKIRDFCQQQFQLSAATFQTLPIYKHTFSHYHLEMFPILIEIKKSSAGFMEEENQIWYNLHQPEAVGLPKPIHSILSELI